MNFFPL